MKKIMPALIKYSSLLASLAFVFATMSNQTNCVLIYHQPKVPAALAKYKQ